MKTAFQKFFECVKFAQIKKLIAKHEFHHFPISRTTMIFSVIVHRNLPFNITIYIFNIPEKTGKLPNFSSLTNHDPEKRKQERRETSIYHKLPFSFRKANPSSSSSLPIKTILRSKKQFLFRNRQTDVATQFRDAIKKGEKERKEGTKTLPTHA